MSTAENALFSVFDIDEALDKSPFGLSERQKKMRKTVNLRPVNLQDILKYIDIQDMEAELKAALVKQVSRYPHQALQRFADNFEAMVTAAQRKLRKTYVMERQASKPEGNEPVDVGTKPSGKYVKAKPPEPKPTIKAKKIDIGSLPVSEPEKTPDEAFDFMEVPVESLDQVDAVETTPLYDRPKAADKPKVVKPVKPVVEKQEGTPLYDRPKAADKTKAAKPVKPVEKQEEVPLPSPEQQVIRKAPASLLASRLASLPPEAFE